jgi:hypothetical protein
MRMLGVVRAVRGLGVAVVAGLAMVALAACGSSGSGSSGDAQMLLRQTFGGSHVVNSGNLSFSLTVDPNGSSKLAGPITVTLGGPFQSLGKGKLPKSDFSFTVSALGQTGSIGVLSTGTAGYVTLEGQSYRLPPATFQKLESSFAQLASGGSAGSGSTALSRLGINPLHWLVNPTVVGTEQLGGTSTTHIHAGINVAALLRDLNTFLGKASALSSGAAHIPSSISPATQSKLVSKIHSPSFDLWTGNSDKTVRKLQISLTPSLSGQISSEIGTSPGITLTMQYADLNRPQSIVAPTSLAPYSQFTTRLQSILQEIQGVIGTQLSPSSGSSSTTPSGTTTSGSGSYAKYSQCILAAHNDVTKMTKCAKLLNGG